MDGSGRGKLVYLDTHVVLWLHDGLVEKLSSPAVAAIEAGRLLISGMVMLELQSLLEVGRIRVTPEQVRERLAGEVGLSLGGASLAEVAAVAANYGWTRDPFDRIICAEAVLSGGVLVSADEVIRRHLDAAVW